MLPVPTLSPQALGVKGVKPLLPQPGGFEGLGSLLKHPKASDLPILDGKHERAPRGHLDPIAALYVGGVRDHDFGTSLCDVVRLEVVG